MTTLSFLSRVLEREEAVARQAILPEGTGVEYGRQAAPQLYRRNPQPRRAPGAPPMNDVSADASAAGYTTDTICPTCFNQVRVQYAAKEAA
jgi:hypothetical protein